MSKAIILIIEQMVFLFLIIGLGFILRRWAIFNRAYMLLRKPDMESAKIYGWRTLAKFAYNVSFPALMLDKLGQKEWQPDYFPFLGELAKIAIVYLIVIVGLAFIIPQNKRFKPLTAAIANQGNTAFLGFPLIIGVMGNAFLPYAAMLSATMVILGNATSITVLGMAQGKCLPDMIKQTLRKVCFDPVILSCLIGGTISYFRMNENSLWPWIQFPASIIGWTATPFALLCIGSNMRFQKGNLNSVLVVTFLKLIIAPVVVLVCLRLFSELSPDLKLLVALLMSTPVAASMTVLTEKYSGDRESVIIASNAITL